MKLIGIGKDHCWWSGQGKLNKGIYSISQCEVIPKLSCLTTHLRID